MKSWTIEVEKEEDYNLSLLFQPSVLPNQSFSDRKVGRKALVKAQWEDVSLLPLFEQTQVSESESGPTTKVFFSMEACCLDGGCPITIPRMTQHGPLSTKS